MRKWTDLSLSELKRINNPNLGVKKAIQLKERQQEVKAVALSENLAGFFILLAFLFIGSLGIYQTLMQIK